MGRTTGWNAKVEMSGLAPKDNTRLRRMYNIPLSVQIMIPSLGVLDSGTSPIGWTTFHDKALWLRVRFPLYPIIRNFLTKTQFALGKLMPNGWKCLLCLT